MKENSKSKAGMNIFHYAIRQIMLISNLLGCSADEQRTKSDAPNLVFGASELSHSAIYDFV
jgi:hypothetical protein